MSPLPARNVVVLAALVVLLAVRPSRAGDIDVRTRDGTPWTLLVTKIQDDPASQGHTFPILVFDGSTRVPCGEYELRLDEVAAAAFQVEACNLVSDATTLRLVHREALFEPGDIVPRARKASISATITRRGHVDGGGAAPLAGSKLWCTVALQPYLWDGLRGEPTPLMPDRFVLRPIEANIHAAPDGAGWIARGESRFGLRFHYEVDDLQTGKKVLENEATLACVDSPAGQARAIVDTSASEPAAAPQDGPKPPPWWAAVDVPHPVFGTVVATMLVRPTNDIVLPGGVRGSSIYGSGPAVYGGSTVGASFQRGMLFVPGRFTVATDGNALVLSGFAGVGVGWNVLHHTSLYAAPALRFTGMLFPQGWFNQLDGALLVGVRRRFWGSRRCPSAPGGFEAFFEAAAPVASTGVWFVSAGVTNSWGPGGGYPWMVSLARCGR